MFIALMNLSLDVTASLNLFGPAGNYRPENIANGQGGTWVNCNCRNWRQSVACQVGFRQRGQKAAAVDRKVDV